MPNKMSDGSYKVAPHTYTWFRVDYVSAGWIVVWEDADGYWHTADEWGGDDVIGTERECRIKATVVYGTLASVIKAYRPRRP